MVRPWLCITGISVIEDLGEELAMGVDSGVLIVQVIPGSPPDQAGLRGGSREVVLRSVRFLIGGDVITSVIGRIVRDMNRLIAYLNRLDTGKRITIRVYRDRTPMELTVLLAEKP
ncbi:MAG: PDZ domain-containing protein [Pseudomonadota bacterium]